MRDARLDYFDANEDWIQQTNRYFRRFEQQLKNILIPLQTPLLETLPTVLKQQIRQQIKDFLQDKNTEV